MTFFQSFKKMFLIGGLLIVAAGVLTWWASPTQEDNDEQVTKIFNQIDKTYADNADVAEKRKAIIASIHKEGFQSKLAELGSHFAEALFLAGVMILTTEAITKYFQSKDEASHLAKINASFDQRIHEISEKVFKAMVDMNVPDKIGKEITAILKSNVCRLESTYAVALMRDPFSGLHDDEIVIRRELSYKISNRTGAPLNHPVRINVISHTGTRTLHLYGRPVTLPRICEVKIGGDPVKVNGDQFFEKWVPVSEDPDETLEVHSIVEEIGKSNDRALYVLRDPCIGVALHIDNQIPHLVELIPDQVYLTSGSDRLRKDIGQSWKYGLAVLSGTALSVAWGPKRKELPASVLTGLEDVEIV